ncbi:MAG: glycosyltransferase family 9 protein, partial [FCB group bacterium]|nr:glycosyltransferase family 9 protein [FCB group bacterium]
MKKSYGSYIVEGKIIYLLWFLEIVFRFFFAIRGLLIPLKLKPFAADTENIRKILVIEIVGMGDAVLATSVVRPLKERFPDAKIVFLGNPAFIPIVENSFDRCIPLSAPWVRKKSKLSWISPDWIKFLKETALLRRERFDLSIDIRCDFRAAYLSHRIGARHRLGFDFGLGTYFYTDPVPYGKLVHRSHEYAKILEHFDLPTDSCSPYLTTGDSNIESILDKIELEREKYYLIHPGAARKYKIWPADSFARVINVLHKTHPHLQPVLIGGSKDITAMNSIETLTGNQIMTYQPSIGELNALIAGAKFVICNNTGVMHIAAALGKNVVT